MILPHHKVIKKHDSYKMPDVSWIHLKFDTIFLLLDVLVFIFWEEGITFALINILSHNPRSLPGLIIASLEQINS